MYNEEKPRKFRELTWISSCVGVGKFYKQYLLMPMCKYTQQVIKW